jgi:dolichyl-phosphate-mannose-protein mannosyltransferase
MLKWINNRPLLVLCFVLTFLFLAGEGPEILPYPPRSAHIFRQSDCLAYTKTYYQRNSGFFTPAQYNLIGKGGRVVSEFPILYYISAKLCRLFGFHYSIIRGVTALCFFIGVCYLFLCCRFWVKDLILALFPVVILATSPALFYYAVNYLPNAPAIGFSFAGLYYVLRYRQEYRVWHLVLSTLFFTLACLLKPTDGGLVWAGYLCTLCTGLISGKTDKKKLLPVFVSAAVVGSSIVWWYLFVKQYNHINGNEINLQGIYPIWDISYSEIAETFRFRILTEYVGLFHHLSLLILLAIFLIIYIVKWKSLDWFLKIFTLYLIIGNLIYSVLWYNAFHIHDYYLLIYTIPAVFLSITVVEYYYRVIAPRMRSYGRYSVYTVLTGLMIVGIYHNQYIQLGRYADKESAVANAAVYEVEPYLRKIGISEADSVLSVPDGSPDITLVAYGNPGYASDLFSPGLYSVPYCKERGIKYMIISDARYIHDPAYEPYTSKKIGEYKGIYIYDIR